MIKWQPRMDVARRLRVWRDENGNAAMVFALVTPLMVGGAGLAVETSFDYVSQSQLQSAADAAAYAAGLEKMGGSSNDVITAAANAQATQNGWTGGITVNTPPTSGAYAGQANAVEVRLT